MVHLALLLCVVSVCARLAGLAEVAENVAIAAAGTFVLAALVFALLVLVVSVGGAVTGPSRHWLPDP